MIGKRTRVLSKAYHLGAGYCHWFYILESSGAAVRAIKAAKIGGNAKAAEWIKRVFDTHLNAFFGDFLVTVPRGNGLTNFMYCMWKDDNRFVPCFDYETPIGRNHFWAARLESSREQELVPEAAAQIRGRNIALLDDVFTTGGTLMTHLVPLLRAGARATGLVLTVR